MSRYLVNIEQNLLAHSNHFDNATWAKAKLFIGSDAVEPINPTLHAPMLLVDSNTGFVSSLLGTADIESGDTGYFSTIGLFRLHPNSSTDELGLGFEIAGATSYYIDESIRGLYNWVTDVFCGYTGVDSRAGDAFYTSHLRLNSEWVILSLSARNTYGLEWVRPTIYPTGLDDANATGSIYVQQMFAKKGIILDTPLFQITSGTAQTLSDDWVTLEPEYNLKQRDTKQENIFRVRSGRRYVYSWGDSKSWRFNVRYVNSAIVATVNSWWESDTELLYGNIDRTEVNTVRLENRNLPIAEFEKPYDDLFKGKIELGTY